MYANRAVPQPIDSPVHRPMPASAAAGQAGSALLDAGLGRDCNAVRRLLQGHPASVHFQDARGNTALHVAIGSRCDLAVIDLLLAHRADPAVVNHDGNTCMHLALALRPPVPQLPMRLLQARWRGDGRGLGTIGMPNTAGRTALMLAQDANGMIARGYEAAVDEVGQALLEWMTGSVASLDAAVQANDAIAAREVIVRSGWNLDAPLPTDSAAGNIILYALRRRSYAVVVECARLAAEQRITDVLNAADLTGYVTPLIVAVVDRHQPVLKALIEAGADVGQRNRFGMTAMHMAARGGALDCVRTLLDHGADPDARTDDRVTPMMVAAEAGHLEIVQLLQRAGANVNARDVDGATPIMYAYLGGQRTVASKIAALGGRQDAVDRNGMRVSDYVQLGRELNRQPKKSRCTLL